MPTRSARRKVPVRGQPMAGPVSASTSSMDKALLEHQVGGVEHDGDADAIGDEVGRVVREDNLLAEDAIGEGGEGGDGGGIGLGEWESLRAGACSAAD